MALKFTDLDKKELFSFMLHEYPESLPLNYTTKLNKIQYPENHWTNQIIGTYLDEIEWSGKFEGSYFNGSKVITAKERSDMIWDGKDGLLGKVIRVQYAIGGNDAGNVMTVIIEKYDRKINNENDIDYTIKLVPHEPQTRTKPTAVTLLSVGSQLNALVTGAGAIGNKLPKVGSGNGGSNGAKKPNTPAGGTAKVDVGKKIKPTAQTFLTREAKTRNAESHPVVEKGKIDPRANKPGGAKPSGTRQPRGKG